MKNRPILIGLMLAVFLISGCGIHSAKVENLSTFAKAYGYVKYFHPSDEAVAIDWSKFSAYGAKEIEKCRTSKDVVETLNKLFSPIAPSVRFSLSKNKPDYDLKLITPENLSGYKLTYWQHQGVSTGMKIKGTYQSVRVYRDTKPSGEQLFDFRPKFGYIITKNIGDDIYCQVPLVLYCNDQNTYPRADTLSLKKFQYDLKQLDYNKNELSLRIGNVINVYNVFQHFYPYFSIAGVNWDKEMEKALLRCYSDSTPKDHLITLQKFTAPLKDGHISVYNPLIGYAVPPIAWEWIENQLVITHNYKNNPDLHVGDIVTRINGKSPEKFFNEVNSLISAGTKGWLNNKSDGMSLWGVKGSILNLIVNDKTINLPRENIPYEFEYADKNKELRYKQIGDNIWYLNMDRIEMDTINKLLSTLEKCKAIVCDARGYPNNNHEFITHLMKSDDTTRAWMQIPRIVYPDQENITGYAKFDWIEMMKARKPYLGDKKVVYIIDGSAISYAESCLGYIEGYKLATLVGQPTAGTNGNINPFELPGGYTIYWTGMKVLKHNGSQHHGIGIIPDVYVSKTIRGIREGRDEFLEKAIEIAQQK